MTDIAEAVQEHIPATQAQFMAEVEGLLSGMAGMMRTHSVGVAICTLELLMLSLVEYLATLGDTGRRSVLEMMMHSLVARFEAVEAQIATAARTTN